MTGLVRLLGIGTHEGAAAIRLALARVDGAALVQHKEADFVAFAQREPAGPRRDLNGAAQLQAMRVVHRRLKAGCRVAPFLPANPAVALCPAAELPALLAAAEGLGEALARDGATHQWQVTLRWPAERWLALHRPCLAKAQASDGWQDEAALPNDLIQAVAGLGERLEMALAPTMLRLARLPAASETELRFMVLVPRACEEIIEQALQTLPEDLLAGCSAELEGPMPPVSFAAWQVAEAEEPVLRAAWTLLGSPDRVETEALRRRRHDPAPGLPDAGGDALAQIENRLSALPLDLGGSADFTALLPRARRRLVPAMPMMA